MVTSALVATMLPGVTTTIAAGPSTAWTRQFGTSDYDYAAGIAIDADGNAHVVGDTDGTFPGQTSEGASDVFVRMYGPDGSLVWTRQFGTRGRELAAGIAIDANGNAYVVGWTEGTFPGQTSEGASDAFVRMYRR